jgi:hypothetical protein
MRFLTLLLLALFVLGRAHSAPAQTIGATSGTINGSIADESGAVLPGVTVTVSGSAQMGTRSMTSDDRGLYRFPNLPPGDYRLMYELPGFQTIVRDGIQYRARASRCPRDRQRQ